jgi:hypothetical protein
MGGGKWEEENGRGGGKEVGGGGGRKYGRRDYNETPLLEIIGSVNSKHQ